MKTGLTHKLFAAFFLTSILIVGCFLAIQLYAARNFSEYLSRVTLEDLGGLVRKLAKTYQSHGNWDELRDDPEKWSELLASEGIALPMHPRPPGPGPGINPVQVPARPPGPPQYEPGPSEIGPRLTLFDDQQDRIVGNPEPLAQHVLRPIAVSGKTVGWLGLHGRKEVSDPLAAAFLSRQYRLVWLMGIVVFAGIMLITVILARHLLVPIKALAAGTRELMASNFKTRVTLQRSDELGQLAQDFNAMARALEKDELTRRQWITDISHELRTPLAVLQGEIEALQDGVRQVSPQTLASLAAEVRRVSSLVADLHLLSLADSRNLLLDKSPLNPADLLDQVLAAFETRLHQKQIRIQVTHPPENMPPLMADARRMQQVLANIFENTIRYADSPGMLNITLSRINDRLRLVFEDSGAGVPDHALSQLFDRLYRVDTSRSRDLGGSGLGLAICRQIVEGHNGRITAAHSALGGLLIRIDLPLALSTASS